MSTAVSAVELSSFVFASNDDIKTTSLLVAEKFGKLHKDVLKKIESLECSSDFHKRNFAPMQIDVEIGNGAVRKSPAYEMTKDGFMFLVMGFTGKAAAQIKEAYINAFNLMHDKLFPKTPYGLKIGVEKISPAQRQEIRRTVAKIVNETGKDYQTIYWGLHEYFNINEYKELNACDFDKAMEFLTGKPQPKMVMIAADELEALRNEKEFDYLRFIELMNKSESAGYRMVDVKKLQTAIWLFNQQLENMNLLG